MTKPTEMPYTIITVDDLYAVQHPDGRRGQACQYLEADAQRRFLNRGWAAAMAAAREELERQREVEARERGMDSVTITNLRARVHELESILREYQINPAKVSP